MRILFATLLLARVAAAASPAVAVMPFKDLSGSAKGSIGEAIRETVTSDLKDVPGLRVIERGNIDKILAEQNLQARKADLDPIATVKVGKLLGASLIVAGAYQRASSNVRLTARFVKVETGEIVGSAKVDGSQSEFLKLQDRVTSALLRSAGIADNHVQRFAARPRPKLKTLRSVELYGDAVVEEDSDKKRALLREAVKEDPGFTYASHDLDELEQRLRSYDVLYRRQTDREVATLLESLKTEKDALKLQMAYGQAIAKLMMQRRVGAVVQLCAKVPNLPPSYPGVPTINEQCAMYTVGAYQQMNDCDAVLREGEKFLSKYGTSSYFMTVRMQMDGCITQKRKIEDGKVKIVDALAKLTPEERGDACKLGTTYLEHAQYKDARKSFEACAITGHKVLPKWFPYAMLVTTSQQQGDFVSMRKYFQQLEKVDPEQAKSYSAFLTVAPADL